MKFSLPAKMLLLFTCSVVFLSFRITAGERYIFDEGCYAGGARELVSFHLDPNMEHPPLAKYLIAATMEIFGDDRLGRRIAPAIFGSLLLVVVYLWLLPYGETTAWIAVVLTGAGGFWFVLSRVCMISIFEVFFCVLGFYLLDKKKHLLCGLSLGAAVCCRWNAVFAVALIVIWLFAHKQIGEAFLVGLSSIVSYVALYLPAAKFSMAQLVWSQFYAYEWHRNAIGNPAVAQPWYEWFYRTTPEKTLDNLLACPILVGLGLISVGYLLYQRKAQLLAVAPLVFTLAWCLIGRRWTYYYYFLDAYLFLGFATAVVLGQLKNWYKWIPVAFVVLWFSFRYPYFTG